jgi:predicted N-acyltransferase
MPIIGLGSPVLDECPIAVPIEAGAEFRRDCFRVLLATLEQHADDNGVRVLALKDVTDTDRVWANTVLGELHYAAIPAPPIAKLALPFKSEDEYLASLSPKMRQDLRRKMRQASAVRIEYRDSIEGLDNEIDAFYRATRDHRKASFDAFDELPGGYFREVMHALGGTARLQLMWIGDDLGGFNLFIETPDRIDGKFLGLDYRFAREHNLYFVNWMEMVRYAIARGIPQLHVGSSAYGLKVRLGCKLHRSWVYVRHTGLVRGPLFRLLSPYAAFDRMDPDLIALGDEAPYAEPELRPATGGSLPPRLQS